VKYSAGYSHVLLFFKMQHFEWQGHVYIHNGVTAKKNQNTLLPIVTNFFYRHVAPAGVHSPISVPRNIKIVFVHLLCMSGHPITAHHGPRVGVEV
jgi:hypothetical protein